MAGFIGELKRRKVYRVAVAYAVVGWLLIQVATQVFPFLDIPNWAVRLVIAVTVLGFPLALVVSWIFDLTPHGLERTAQAEPSPEKAPAVSPASIPERIRTPGKRCLHSSIEAMYPVTSSGLIRLHQR